MNFDEAQALEILNPNGHATLAADSAAVGHRQRSAESGGDERDELLDLPRLRAARVCALVCDLSPLLALLRHANHEGLSHDATALRRV